MQILHIALYAILATSFVFAVIELGVSGHSASIWQDAANAYNDFYGNVDTSVPGILSFAIFASVWTMLVTVAALVLSWFYTRKGANEKLNSILGFSFAALYFVTMVFWLAVFADIASELNGYTSTNDDVNAIIAFAVLLWLLFIALFVLSVLALCGVLVSDWAGYQSVRKTRAVDAPSTNNPAPEVPMSTNPVASPSELSTRDAEPLHEQPNNQQLSPSSVSAIASAELSAESVHHHQANHT
ncbi:hypothetical protein N7488_007630 [Penicillium malachiteum]|nr:hypothetical protein N7488_007630 [Penicillium malachiteum]